MLYPQMNKSRAVLDLNGLWKFRLLKDEDEFTPGMVLTDNFEWIAVPASYNDQKEFREYRRYTGFSIYQREFLVPACYKSERMVLRLDAVTNKAIVYIGAKEVARHQGGYLPFEVELTDEELNADSLLITVLVDNRVGNDTLPGGNDTGMVLLGLSQENAKVPSVAAAEAYRNQKNLVNFDFFNYAGLNRPVRIYTTPKAYIDDITLCTDIDGTTGIVSYEIEVVGGDAPVAVAVKDAEGKVVATAEGKANEIKIENANLWWPKPGVPYLYTMEITYGQDSYSQTFGIRTVKVDGKQFLINGKPFYFKGFGKHEDSAIHGRGLDLCLNVKDTSMIHWLNANSFRTSHYPYAEEMYDLCDREGIVMIDETPAVGLRAFAGRDAYEVFTTFDHHKDVIRDMIKRDKNHPCVVMWSIGNEPDLTVFPESAANYWLPLYELAHELDKQDRPVTLVNFLEKYQNDLTSKCMDVISLNRYYAWYDIPGDLETGIYALNVELDHWAQFGKPVLFTEYGADTIAGFHASVPEMFTEEYQAEFLLAYGEAFDKRDFVVGEQLWNFADFGTTQGTMRVDGNKKGILTRDRRPKLAAHAMRKRWSEIPNFDYKK